MPKVRTIETLEKGTKVTAELHVSKHGKFAVTKTHPFTIGAIEGYDTADAAKPTTTAKVILVKFNTDLIKERESAFSRGSTLNLEAQICEETTTTVDGQQNRSYVEHPDVSGMHKENPIPWRLQIHDYRNRRELWEAQHTIVVPWTQEAETAICNACHSITALVTMLDAALATPDAFTAAIAGSGLLALPEGKAPTANISD